MRCKKQREFASGAQEVKFGNKGLYAMKGKCSECDTTMFKIIGKKKA